MSNPREFDGYEAAKKHYDAMLEDRTRYGELNVEIRRLEKQLDSKKIPLTAERKEEIRPDMEA